MQYFSLQNKQHRVNFETAVVQGLAPDRGLYFPETIPTLSKDFIQQLHQYTDQEIGYQVIQSFVGDEIPEEALKKIVADTLHFPFPVQKVSGQSYALELFHGPTLAFKDVGARFMAGCLGYFRRNSKEPVTVLVATSGDTGGAVASGFYNVPGVEVVILYPSRKVSTLQEKQLTTLGGNIRALEIQGTFDDCQQLVKTAFLDKELQARRPLTSANSINVARWLPQMFYYFLAYKQMKAAHPRLVFSVPSGNFGNICAGLMAAATGLPVAHFVAATNINDTVPRFMESGKYEPAKAFATLSNAMDVADPSNFVRVLALFGNSLPALQEKFTAYSFSDKDTIQAMEQVWKEHHYMLDPHGAVGFLGLQQYLETAPELTGVFLETAHPVKFEDTAPETLRENIATPARVMTLYDKEKTATLLQPDYTALKNWLLR
ncbi:threonine synthase [Chitinophaga nivalis]|uniref:Threonine synthase n=1 Tax=Chitinophaga nivalis TaxID=2991709 RepID=A0ABT3IHJ1_9BACT|nr:threonine synthase [Chitinophaga nivalis]MCW3466874.1 threonine synthase [Chitinophaga nivalis]MCW3483435.1 threonine synthase [Chitinophaga nivalis]